MNTLDIKMFFDEKIRGILENPDFQNLPYIDRGFASIGSIKKDSILFIGLNPSYTDDSKISGVGYYNLEQEGNTYKRYFKKFEDLSKRQEWGHLDLLFVRETKQENIDNIMHQEHGVSFIWEQLKVTNEILIQTRPKVIIVCNTKARHFLGKDMEKKNNNEPEKWVWLGYNFKFDEQIGTHRITNENSPLKGTPVFFTSMLSGQRALDNGSFERLEWHVKFTINNGRVL